MGVSPYRRIPLKGRSDLLSLARRERERGERQRIGIHRRENGFPISCWLPLSGRRSIKPAPSRRVSGYLNAPPPLMYTFPRRFGNALSLLDQHTQFLVSSFSLSNQSQGGIAICKRFNEFIPTNESQIRYSLSKKRGDHGRHYVNTVA